MMKTMKMEEMLKAILHQVAQVRMSIPAAVRRVIMKREVAYLMVDEGEDKDAHIDEMKEDMDVLGSMDAAK